MDEADEAEDPPPGAIDMNQVLNDATELALGSAAANARTANDEDHRG
jgi:hypothetical protein